MEQLPHLFHMCLCIHVCVHVHTCMCACAHTQRFSLFFCSQLFYNFARASSHLCNHSVWTWFFFFCLNKLYFCTHTCSWTFEGGHHDYGINDCVSATTGRGAFGFLVGVHVICCGRPNPARLCALRLLCSRALSRCLTLSQGCSLTKASSKTSLHSLQFG